jgi:hypothetical protein
MKPPGQRRHRAGARRVAAKLLVNLSKRPDAIKPRDRIPCDLHPAKLSRGLTGVKGGWRDHKANGIGRR